LLRRHRTPGELGRGYESIDPGRKTLAIVVVKKNGLGAMPGLISGELKTITTSFLEATRIDVLMPQDAARGQGRERLRSRSWPEYFGAMQMASESTHTALWSVIETYTARRDWTGHRFPPAPALRIREQVKKVSLYVSGFVSWIFGDDLSPQATYYPVEANELNREYRSAGSLLPLQSYELLSPASPLYPDTRIPSKLSDRTGGGYDGVARGSWVGSGMATSTCRSKSLAI
jgi:hypothetical protein